MHQQAERIGLEPAVERAADGGPVLDEEESVLHKFKRLQLVIGASGDQGEGTLFFTEWRIFWLSSAEPAVGYSCDFPTISMHAIATDEESFNRPCLYIQLDNGEEVGGMGGASSGSEEEEEEEQAAEVLPELRLIPAEPSHLEAIFQAFCEGAERNPDFSEADDDDEGDGFFYNEDEVLAGAAQAAIGVGDVDELVGEDPGRFEDAEGEDEVQQAAGGSPHGQQPNGGC